MSPRNVVRSPVGGSTRAGGTEIDGGPAADCVRLHLLGPPRVEFCGSLVRGFESRKALTLLCYLAAIRQPVTRSRLADLFWCDKTERRGRGNLSRVLHNINQLLPGVVSRERTATGLRRQRVWTDLDAFAELERADDVVSLARAADLYRGDFLAGMDVDKWSDLAAWLDHQREHWRRRASRVLSQLAKHHSGRGESRLALDYASRLLSLDPWSEEAHRQMMRAFAGDGQRTRALAQYETCRRVLAEELGVSPSQATQVLYQQIKSLGGETPMSSARASEMRTVVWSLRWLRSHHALAPEEERLLERICHRMTARQLSPAGAVGLGRPTRMPDANRLAPRRAGPAEP